MARRKSRKNRLVRRIWLAVAAIPQQILYWSNGLGWMFRIDLAFWVLFAAAACVAWWWGLSIISIFLLVLACCFLRLISYILAAVRASASLQQVSLR